ncbi:fimbrial protein [Scandinavium goeteborgense]|uniref:fimbrial protein n=1 Tax=Scandinavium goeteborgense TaxID=1851514 RepID=UPI003803D116
MYYLRHIVLFQLFVWPSAFAYPAMFSGAELGAFTESVHGRAKMSGSITDSACALDIDSRDQSIDLGVISTSEIEQFGHGADTPFTIKLIDCTLVSASKTQPNWNYFSVTFDGNIIDGDLFGLSGSVHGVGISIRDEFGNFALPGQPMPVGIIETGGITLRYRLRLQKDNKSLNSGKYHTVIRYKLDYY